MKKSFRKSFQGFALLSSIFFKRNRIYFQLYTLQIIPCNQLRINLRRVNLSLAFPDPRIFHLYNGESLLSPYIFITIPSQNTLVTSSFGKSLPRTKCYSLIEIFPSLPKLTLPKQIFTRSRDTTTRKLGGGGWRERRVAVYYVTFDRPRRRRGHFEKYIRSSPPPFQKARSFAVAAGKIAYRSSPYVHWLRLHPSVRRSRGINKTGDNVNESV